MGSLGPAMDLGRGGRGTAKPRPACRWLLRCWLQRPITPVASCSADLTGASVRKDGLKQWKSNSGTEHGGNEAGQYQALGAKSLGRLRT
jgi:hypothetical protein